MFTATGVRVIKILVAPALAVMNRLNYVLKFLLIGLLLLLPFAYVTHLMVKESDKQIVFNQKESYGVEYITPALQLLGHIQAARNYSAAVVSGEPAFSGDLANEIRSIQTLIPRIDALDSKFRDDFGTNGGKHPCTDRWREIRDALDEGKLRALATQEGSLGGYAQLSSLVKDWILNYAANYSNLILDPDLDSYWLMDAFVAKLPVLMDDIAQASSRAIAHRSSPFSRFSTPVDRGPAGADPALEERLALHGLYTDATSTLDALVNVNLKTAYDYNNGKSKTVEPALGPLVQTTLTTTRAFFALIRNGMVLPANPHASTPELIGAARQALDAVTRLSLEMGPLLNGLIVARVESYRHDQITGKLAAEAATFLHVYLFIAFYIAVHASVTKLGTFTQRMIEGTTEHFELDSRDELGAVAASYNKINAALIETRFLKAQIERRTAELQVSEEEARRRTVELSAANERLQRASEERERVEMKLRQAQKLESVGRLASGIAHEINTPIQFVGDSIHFARDALSQIATIIVQYQALGTAIGVESRWAGPAARIKQAEEDADMQYLLDNVPGAFDRCVDGLGRVSTIVRSMKEFAHPDSKDKAPADLNRAIETTLSIARNEYKYIADLKTEFGELPPVSCHVGELNQVVLNIVVNAAHAIGDVVKGSDQRGTISVATRCEGDHVEITIADTGGGIPAAIQDRVFDPFFTTKEVGRGTGQGLAIARSVVVEKHGGTITFNTEAGKGTTFIIRLPIAGSGSDGVRVAA